MCLFGFFVFLPPDAAAAAAAARDAELDREIELAEAAGKNVFDSSQTAVGSGVDRPPSPSGIAPTDGHGSLSAVAGPVTAEHDFGSEEPNPFDRPTVTMMGPSGGYHGANMFDPPSTSISGGGHIHSYDNAFDDEEYQDADDPYPPEENYDDEYAPEEDQPSSSAAQQQGSNDLNLV